MGDELQPSQYSFPHIQYTLTNKKARLSLFVWFFTMTCGAGVSNPAAIDWPGHHLNDFLDERVFVIRT
jgi:hypothetical protein